MTLNGQFIKKIEWDLIYWPRKNNLQILFFSNLEKNLLTAYMENTLNGEKSVKINHISVNNRAP
jgi:hypothetical protein